MVQKQLHPAYEPPIPYELDRMGVPWPLLTDIFARRAYVEGTSSFSSMKRNMKMSHPVVEAVFRHLLNQQFLEIKGVTGEEYFFTLTNAGKQFAESRLKISEYSGPAPVSLTDYRKAVVAQRAQVRMNRANLYEALSDLVCIDETISQLGPAVVAQKSLFLYGPTGTGKTSLAERLLRVYEDCILVPYAVEVDNQIILVYDPVLHQRVEGQFDNIDHRYVVCRRPCVIVGGELTSPMLDLRHDATAKIYSAPLQMKANNGILVIDDFGRQVMQPRELLNRWIVPLDRRVDYLNLHYGVKFEIPFELMVVFSTNLNPLELAEEAFLRRIHNKLYVAPSRPDVFDEIYRRVVVGRGLQHDPLHAEHMRAACAQMGYPELRACYPGDLVEIAVAICEFDEQPVVLSTELIDKAAAIYFTRNLKKDQPIGEIVKQPIEDEV
jgi:hypothetical protein